MKNEDTEKINNAGNPFYLLFIFIIIIGFIFFIPELYEKYNKDRASLYGIGSKNEKESTKEEKPTSKISDHFRKEDSVTFENLAFLNIKIDGNTLYMDINNISSKSFDLSKGNFYLEFYKVQNNQRFFVNRRMIKTATPIESKKTVTISIDISGITVDDGTTFAIARVDDGAVPEVKIENNTLTCTKSNITYIYSFTEESLIKTEYKIVLNKDATILNNYKEIEKKYNNLNGVTASIYESDSTFTFSSIFDYNIISKYSVDINNLYEKDIRANVISFKNSAEGFDCK